MWIFLIIIYCVLEIETDIFKILIYNLLKIIKLLHSAIISTFLEKKQCIFKTQGIYCQPPYLYLQAPTSMDPANHREKTLRKKKFQEVSKRKRKFATYWQLFTKHLHCVRCYKKSGDGLKNMGDLCRLCANTFA